MKNLCLILTLNHYLCALWFAVGKASGKQGWVERMQYDVEDYGVQYLAALQWSLAQTTPGSSPITPVSTAERIVGVLVLVAGMVTSILFVSSITSAMSAVWAVNRFKNTQSFLLKKFLNQMDISRELGARVTRYVDCVVELRHKKVPISKVEYLKLLSGPLNVELHTALFQPHLTNHPFFAQYHHASRSAARQLCSTAVHSEDYAKNDTVFERFTEAKHMHFLAKGTLAYRFLYTSTGKSKRTMRLDVNQWCCEPALWIVWEHCGHLKGLTDCESMMLHVGKFSEVTKSHHNIFLAAREEAM